MSNSWDDIRVRCSECMRETNHEVLHDEPVPDLWGDESSYYYRLVKCRGCDTIALVIDETWSQLVDGEAKDLRSRQVYPHRFGHRKPIKRHEDVPEHIRGLYLECLSALGSEAPTLTGVGIRAVIEGVCNDQQAEGGGLADKINDLVTKEALSKNQATFLHHSRVMGNRAAHEIGTPSEDELGVALDIAENLLQTLYILPETTRRLGEAEACEEVPSPPDIQQPNAGPGDDDEDPFGDE